MLEDSVAGRVTHLPGVPTVNHRASRPWSRARVSASRPSPRLTSALLHGPGLPTRYVFGHLHPEREACSPRRAVRPVGSRRKCGESRSGRGP
ncbi:hypothetical protein BM536_034015 [Streptomyces phaeoluteigriseus]|uniref:Uncharacterized protein n=1 Tax=Streptomyces phaeoluteigriseus TaxID=114686 RepID=A0A1V6MKZ0_9ACTN|nr:hypothetical protein BM536_034015 [Streptomyces phaeoluteigriseus]